MSIENLVKKHDSHCSRLTVAQAKESKFLSQLSWLRVARGDAIAEEQDATAIDAERKGVEVELADCQALIGGLERGINKLLVEIAAEKEREANAQRLETEAVFSKLLGKAVDLCEKLEPIIRDLGEAGFPLVFARGAYLPTFETLPGYGDAPQLVRNLLSENLYRMQEEIVAGSRTPTSRPAAPATAPRPRTQEDVQANVTSAFDRLKRPKIELFSDCFPGRINFGDVDAIVEINGKGLMLEWKEGQQELKRGQLLMYERLTKTKLLSVFVVSGNAETMVVDGLMVWFSGKGEKWKSATLDILKQRIRNWVQWAQKNEDARAENQGSRPNFVQQPQADISANSGMSFTEGGNVS